ncbi:MAG: hypothetical protein MJZ14_07825 [Paludibacteraceae bacterium]|nr:hypothetical protein [Paludibacteraceae bacterium]
MSVVIIFLTVLVAVVFMILFFTKAVYKRGLNVTKEWYESNTEVVDGEVTMSSIVSYLKTLDLKKDKHIPFLMKDNCEIFNKLSKGRPFPPKKVGYNLLFVGVQDAESNNIPYCKIIYSKSFDAQINEIFGEESMIVLS